MRRPWLFPLVPLYSIGQKLYDGLKFRGETQRLVWPVISVGNLSAGGTGKTPFTIALAKLLRTEGFEVDVLSRGYGRKSSYAACVDTAGDADVFGDEPLLIAHDAKVPVYVGDFRFEAGKLAESRLGFGDKRVHLLDDGFQHRRLHRGIDIVLVNSEDLSDWLLPAGNLRESLKALGRATAFAVPAADEAAIEDLKGLGLSQPIWRFHREMLLPPVTAPAFAFCGIARPDQFFSGLEGEGIKLKARHAFADHHRFHSRDIRRLKDMLAASKAEVFITTAKDQVRLGAFETVLQEVAPVVAAQLHVVFEEKATITEWLMERLGQRSD